MITTNTIRSHNRASAPSTRTGATLVEILMSLLVMGVGLVSVAALFPVTMLRSIQATQMTNAALLNYQCEDYLRAFPDKLEDHFDDTYTTGDLTIPNLEMTPLSRGWERTVGDASTLAELRLRLPLKFSYVVDPIGYLFNLDATGNKAVARTFGGDFHDLHAANQDTWFLVDRKNAGFNFTLDDPSTPTINEPVANRFRAFSMFASSDSWSEVVSSLEVTKVDAATFTLNDVDPDTITTISETMTANVLVRAIVYDENGRESHISTLSGASGLQISLNQPVPDANGLFDGIPTIRIETFEPRYSCLVTVRKQLLSLGAGTTPTYGLDGVDDNGDGTDDNVLELGWDTDPDNSETDQVQTTGMDLVIFFRRDFSAFAEQIYTAEGLLKGRSDEFDGQPTVIVRWDAAKPDSKPTLKTGNFVFDPRNGFWYQIRGVETEGADFATIKLDRTIEATGQFLMLPQNVIEVYPFPLL